MKRATALPPGKGTKAITTASANPRTRQPAVEPTASQTVVVSACRKASDAKTWVYGATDVPPVSGVKDCWTTRASG